MLSVLLKRQDVRRRAYEDQVCVCDIPSQESISNKSSEQTKNVGGSKKVGDNVGGDSIT